MLTTHSFDVISLSETWLRDDRNLLQYINVPGYQFEYRNRNSKRGGGVGVYLKNHMKYKTRNDIVKIDETIEHLWLEIQGKNKNNSYLLGVFYQPNSVESEKMLWLDKFENVLSQITIKWHGTLVVTGDFNIDIFSNNPSTKRYNNINKAFELTQHIKQATRNGKTLIDHISTNIPSKIVTSNVLPCDHKIPSSLASLRLSGRAGFPVCSNGSSKYTRILPVSLGVV